LIDEHIVKGIHILKLNILGCDNIEKCIHTGHLSNHGKIVMSKGIARGGGPLVFL
jgi:hypothetical protein